MKIQSKRISNPYAIYLDVYVNSHNQVLASFQYYENVIEPIYKTIILYGADKELTIEDKNIS